MVKKRQTCLLINMPKQLLIVFVKNLVLGKVKTRLAKTIGNKEALNTYKKLIDITQNATRNIKADKHIYFSDEIDKKLWINDPKFIQTGKDLGEKMTNAFKTGFDMGYQHIILIGSDLPDMSASIINQAFNQLNKHPFVFGPSTDGGYYLIGMTNFTPKIFKDKPWSQPHLLKDTLNGINLSYYLLQSYNDIDTFEDLKESSIYNEITSNILP